MNLLLTERHLVFWHLVFWHLVFLTIELLRRQLVFLTPGLFGNWTFIQLVFCKIGLKTRCPKLLTFCPSYPFPAFHQFAIPLEKLVPYSLSFVRFSRGLVHFIAEQHTFESSLWLFSSTLPSLLAYFVSVMGGRKQSHRSSLCACELNRRPFSLLHEFGVRSTNFTREGSGIRLMTAAALAWSLRVPNIRC